MEETPATVDHIVHLIHQLSPAEKLALIEHLASDLKTAVQTSPPPRRRGLRGVLKGTSVSAEEIDQARHELWGNFPREDM